MPCRAASRSAGWMPKRSALLRLLLGQGDLGVDLLALAPGGAQALEGGAVLEPVLGEEVVEVVDLDRLGALGGPGVEGLGRRRAGCSERAPLAFSDPLGPPRRRGREWIAISRRPSSSGPATETWIATAPASGRTSGACRVSSSTRLGADLLRRPAAPARGRRCRAGGRRRRRRGRPARGGWRGRGGR